MPTRIISRLVTLWKAMDIYLLLVSAAMLGALFSWITAQREFQTEREQLANERATLVQRIIAVRADDAKFCQQGLDALTAQQRARADEWQDRLGTLATQVENANKNADNCHAQFASVARQAGQAAAQSKVAAQKSTEAADTTQAEHAQSTLLRKYNREAK